MQTANRTEHAPAGNALKINGPLAAIALLSGVTNMLALTSPLFMLQVYDRVLSSGSIPTLVGLAVLAAGLYAFQARHHPGTGTAAYR